MSLALFAVPGPAGAIAIPLVGGFVLAAVSRLGFGPRPAVSRRTPRTGRLPLPRLVTELTPRIEPALARVDTFVDGLADLSLASWLDIGRSIVSNHDLSTGRSAAVSSMDAAITEHGHAVSAWYVRDAVETAAFLAMNAAPRPSSEARRLFAAAHGAAEDLALSLLVRDSLSEADFAVLYAPFAPALAENTISQGVRSRR